MDPALVRINVGFTQQTLQNRQTALTLQDGYRRTPRSWDWGSFHPDKS